MSDVYKMIATCTNCRTSFPIEIPRGKCAFMFSAVCAYCGNQGSGKLNFTHKKPPLSRIVNGKRSWFRKLVGIK